MGAPTVAVDPPALRLELLRAFRLVVGPRDVTLPAHAQRVLAYLALAQPTGGAQARSMLAEALWSEGPEGRAQGSLRTALWRIRQADARLVDADRMAVRLGEHVDVDVVHTLDTASRLLAGADHPTLDPTADADLDELVGDVLPTWEEGWLLLERERVRQIRIHALEALARRLYREGRVGPALDAAYAAISSEPLRESARAVLIDVHLAQGNVGEARRQLDQFARLLWQEMHLSPSPALVARVVPRPRGALPRP